MTKRAAIILAGGKAQRFQTMKGKWQDKVLADLLGKPFLVHVVENVQNVVDEIVVCVNDDMARRKAYEKVLAKHHLENARIVTDIKMDNLGGPMIAILTGLKSVTSEFCLTVPCDMPLLQPRVVEYLFNKAKDARVVVPMWPNGRLETLIMVLERASILEITSTLSHLRRPHPDDIIRGALQVMFVSPIGEIRSIDPDLKSFVNINSQEDLIRLQSRQSQGPVTGNLRLNLGDLPIKEVQLLREASVMNQDEKFLEASEKFSACAATLERRRSFFWAAISREHEGKSWLSWSHQQKKPEVIADIRLVFLKSAASYGLEAEVYQKNQCFLLAQRAIADKAWCEAFLKRKPIQLPTK